jgi:cytidylate kinase
LALCHDGAVSDLLVVTGPPGSGKTTVATVIAERVEAPTVLVSGDAFFGFLRRGAVPPWQTEADRQNAIVTDAAAAAVGRYVAGGYRTVYDGVVGPWFVDHFLARTGLDHLDYVILLPSVERCVERVSSRFRHGFSDQSAARWMHQQFAEASIGSHHVLAGDNATVEDLASAVLEARSRGSLRYRP